MLTPQMIDAMNKATGNNVPLNPNAPPSRAEQIRAIGGIKAPAPVSSVTSQPNPIVETAKNYMGGVTPAADDITGAIGMLTSGGKDTPKGNIAIGARKIQQGDILGGIEHATLGTAADAVKAIFAPISAPIETLLSHAAAHNANSNDPTSQNNVINSPQAQAARQQIADWANQHPTLAKTLGDAFTVGTAALGSGALNTTVGEAASGVKNAVMDTLDAAKTKVGAIKDSMTPKVPPEDVSAGLIKEGGQVTPEQAQASAWKDIQPKNTPTTKLAYSKGGNVTDQTLLKGGELKPTPADQKLIDTHSKLYEDGTINDKMSPNEKQDAINQKAAQLNADQKGFLADHDKAVNLTTRDKSGLIDKLKAVRDKSIVPFSGDATAKGAYDSTIKMFQNELNVGKAAGAVKGATTLTSIDKALTNFGHEMEKFGAWEKTRTGELTDTAKARVMAIRDIYSNARDFISDELGPNNPWKSIRADESHLYEVGDRIAQKISDTVGKSGLQQEIENNPLIKAGVGVIKRIIPYGVGSHL